MPAPRLLVLADSKMLPALASGLRDGGRFDVTAVPFADTGLAQTAAAVADAVAVFYGAPGAPLTAALSALAPKVRERGGRVVAVLQREQAAQRDECFRAGASDVLFMPVPKDQFVDRLAASVALAFAAGDGAPSAVAVATRSSSSRLDRASVCLSGVESPSQLPLKAGETVRLSWGAFQAWGLVARGSPSAQIRFAGLAPDEEARIRDWLKSAPQQPAPAAAQAVPSRPTVAPAAAQRPAPPPSSRSVPRPTPPAQPAAAPARPVATAQPAAVPARPVAGQPAAAPRAAPVAGPPPGFADRKPVRPATPAARPAALRTNGAGGLSSLFDGEAAASAPAAKPTVPAGPPWPGPTAADVCKAVMMQLIDGRTPGREVPGNVVASARKLTALLSVGERASIENTGPESHFAQALTARIALEVATAEGTRLASANVVPAVDADALAALTKLADEAAARLQKEANGAIAKGEVENLQLVTAASASLSRDLLNLKETADRLRGVGAAPRLGAGALDPDVVLPGQPPRPKPAAAQQAAAPVKPELRDFRGLDERPGRAKGVLAALLIVAAAALAGHSFYFAVPRHAFVDPSTAGQGVQRIDVVGPSALVTVTPQWLGAPEANVTRLVQALRPRQVKKAVLMLPNGTSAGVVDVATGKATGMPAPPQ